MWHTGEYQGHWWQAKVYDNGSIYGINEGRVSKLCICDSQDWDHTQIRFNYDRGLDIGNFKDPIVVKIVALCEKLPTSEE